MSNKLEKDIEDIEKYLDSESPLGMFKRREEPIYKFLMNEVEYTGKLFSMADYVAMQRKAQHEFAMIKLNSFIQGVELPKDKLEAIEERIAIFEENLKKGKYDAVQ